jgi:GntR family transcriptional regulator, transcriptional repressor for pyruvate dehydrogenase complex
VGVKALPDLHDKFKPIGKTSLSEEISRQIMDLVANGDLLPGQKLPSERELCVRFGVGRSSLREALRCLAIVGVLETRVGEGTFLATSGAKFMGKVFEWRVVTEKKKDVENLMNVRLALESETVANAVLYARDEQIAELDAMVEKMRSSVENPEEFAMHDLNFHLGIAKASNNDLIYDLLTIIRSQLFRLMKMRAPWPHGHLVSFSEHRQIMDAIRARDVESATALMREHIRKGLLRYQRISAAAENEQIPTAPSQA